MNHATKRIFATALPLAAGVGLLYMSHNTGTKIDEAATNLNLTENISRQGDRSFTNPSFNRDDVRYDTLTFEPGYQNSKQLNDMELVNVATGWSGLGLIVGGLVVASTYRPKEKPHRRDYDIRL